MGVQGKLEETEARTQRHSIIAVSTRLIARIIIVAETDNNEGLADSTYGSSDTTRVEPLSQTLYYIIVC